MKRIIILLNCIVYSPHKYRETEGKKRILVAIFGIKAELKKLNTGMFTLIIII